MSKCILQIIWICCVQKTARKNIKYSRNEDILKIGHHEMGKFLTAYRTTPHSTTGVTQTKLLFNREIRSKIPELTTSGFADSQARDKDAETKQRRTDCADERRGA